MIWRLRHRRTIDRRLRGLSAPQEQGTSGYLALAIGSLVALGIGLGVLGQRIASTEPRPMPCYEDQALVWIDAPHTARCVNLDDLESRP